MNRFTDPDPITQPYPDPWTARRPAAAAATAGERPTAVEPRQAARQGWIVLGTTVVAALRGVAAFARQAYARHRQRQDTRAIYEALLKLDDRTLHDLGFDRSEALSVAMEATAAAERTRLNARPAAPHRGVSRAQAAPCQGHPC